MAQAEKEGKVAILPFKIHALEPLGHLEKGLQDMLAIRTAKKGLHVINPAVVNSQPGAFLPVLRSKDISALGKKLGADWIVAGSLTQIGTRISLDMKIFDMTTLKPPFSFFIVEDDIDRLTDAADRASASIYNQIMGVAQIDLVQVRGNRRVEGEAILVMIRSKKGDSLDYKQLDKDLRAVYKMGFFKDVSIGTEDGPGGKIVTFNVTEKPSIAKISFEGNKEIDDDDLMEETGVKIYNILNRSEITQSINRLKEVYREKGYYIVEIKDKIEELPNNEISLIYEIEEGEKVYVTKIQFVGNTEFDDDDLKDIMETSEKGFLSWITKSGLLDEKRLEFDIHKITSFYHNQGYIKAKAGAPKISYEKETGLSITVEITEGKRYKVNDVKVGGDLIAPEDALLRKMGIRKEEFFNREVLRKDTFALREIYANEGYAYADVSPRTKEDDKNNLVDIIYHISKGKRVRFERINITGNTISRDKVIRRELRVIEGEYFSGQGLKRSTENLHRLGFFEDVEVKTKKGSQDDLMVANINIKEKPTGSFSIGAGYSTFDKAMGMFQLAQSNLFGYGQKLSASLRIGSKTQQFDIRFTEPWLFGKPISAGVDIYNWVREFDEYTKDSKGGALRLGFRIPYLDEFTRGTTRYVYDNSNITDIAPNAAQEIQEMAGKNVSSSITLGIARNSKDRPWGTTRGSLNSLSFEYAGGFLGGEQAFNKVLGTSAWYFPLFWNTVFFVKGRGGWVEQRESDGTLPVYQKFMIGGINTVRGFEFHEITPRDPATLDRLGGEQMVIFNLEYRFPLIKEQGIVGLVFFDAGNVFTDNPDALTVDIWTRCRVKKTPSGNLPLEERFKGNTK
jgi:outer membrane protein insertion porin family